MVAELRHLRTSEKLLQRMYPRLKTMPQLRDQFMQQLADMQLRAQRLDAILNPIGAMQSLPAARRPYTRPLPEGGPMVRTLLLVILVIILLGALPAWPYSAGWGYYPSGGLGLVLVVRADPDVDGARIERASRNSGVLRCW